MRLANRLPRGREAERVLQETGVKPLSLDGRGAGVRVVINITNYVDRHFYTDIKTTTWYKCNKKVRQLIISKLLA